MVGKTLASSHLMKLGIFHATIVTTDNLSGQSEGFYKGEKSQQFFAPVGKQQKVYVKVHDDATVDRLPAELKFEEVVEKDIYANQ